MTAPVRLLLLLVAGAVALAVVTDAAERRRASAGVLVTEDGDTVEVSGDQREAGLTYTAAVTPENRAWIEAAIAAARPEAAPLIAEVDGLVTVGVHTATGDSTLGVTRGGPAGFTIDLDFARLNGDNALDRNVVVLHEFGHVIDFALVDAALGATLDAGIPRGGDCGLAAGCDAVEERFADTFAKWALRGAVSAAGAGYGIPTPASLEAWGAPLASLGLAAGVSG